MANDANFPDALLAIAIAKQMDRAKIQDMARRKETLTEADLWDFVAWLEERCDELVDHWEQQTDDFFRAEFAEALAASYKQLKSLRQFILANQKNDVRKIDKV